MADPRASAEVRLGDAVVGAFEIEPYVRAHVIAAELDEAGEAKPSYPYQADHVCPCFECQNGYGDLRVLRINRAAADTVVDILAAMWASSARI